MKTAATRAPVIGAPLFLITVSVPAWTEKQAQRIKDQVAHMFTGADVSIVKTEKPEPAAAPESAAPVLAGANVDKLAGALLDLKVPESKVAAALGALVTPGQHLHEVEQAAAAPAEVARPFAVGDTLRDVHVADRVVTVDRVDENAFYFADGSCSWASAECYEKVSAGAAEKKAPAIKIKTRQRPSATAATKKRAPRGPKMIGANKR